MNPQPPIVDTVSDWFSIITGLYFFYSMGVKLLASYRHGLVARYRWRIAKMIMPDSAPDKEEIGKQHRALYMSKLLSSMDRNELINAINFVNHLPDWDDGLEGAVSKLITGKHYAPLVRIRACELMIEKLSDKQNGHA